MIAQILKLVFFLGLPVALLSYQLLHWSYQSGRLNRDGDEKVDRAAGLNRDGDAKADRAARKKMKKEARARRKKIPPSNVVHRKWLRFGGGFYGAAGLWTLLVAELADLFSLIVNWPGLAEIFAGGPIAFLIRFITNQIGNFVTAITWFGYWSGLAGDANTGLVFLVAIGAYSLGRRAAKARPG